jgi:hypothetical protein
MDLIEHLHKGMILGLVQKHIFCPFSEQFEGVTRILDVRTCVVVLDRDGDPSAVMAPEAWEFIQAYAAEKGGEPLGTGYTIMER